MMFIGTQMPPHDGCGIGQASFRIQWFLDWEVIISSSVSRLILASSKGMPQH